MSKYKGHRCWCCPHCLKPMAKAETAKGTAKGLTQMHIKFKHEDLFRYEGPEPVLMVCPV